MTSDRHRPGRFTITPWLSPDERRQATALLREHGWSLADFARACFLVLLANPAPFLRRLSEVRESAPKGRPRKGQAPSSAATDRR